MTSTPRDPFRAIGAYVSATHAVFVLTAVAAPAVALMIRPGDPVPTAIAFALALYVAFASGLVLMAGSIPGAPTTRFLTGANRPGLLGATTLPAALALLFLVPDTGGSVTATVMPLALALRAIAGDSFWSGAARIAALTALSAGLVAVTTAATGGTWQPLAIGVAALLAFGVLGQDSMYALALELDDHRRLEAERAIATERKRFAGDLHDIQGQHLQLIAIESQLVAKLIAVGDHASAAEHAQRLEAAAIGALDELHRVVFAYREVSLHDEVANAARVLEAAGVTAQLKESSASLALPEVQDRLLGLTVREAITNILKHSRARSCTLSVQPQSHGDQDGVALIVEDMGPPTPSRVGSPGTGLASLRQRYEELGGELTFALDRGARLASWLPIERGPA